jgi:hypothetical protein
MTFSRTLYGCWWFIYEAWRKTVLRRYRAGDPQYDAEVAAKMERQWDDPRSGVQTRGKIEDLLGREVRNRE